MPRRGYTHVQELLPEIRAMEAARKAEKEIAESLGLRNEYIEKQLLTRERRKEKKIIAYIRTRQGVLYLSVIRDLFGSSIVAYKTGTEQTINLVLDTIRLAMRKEKEGRCRVATSQRPRLSICLASISISTIMTNPTKSWSGADDAALKLNNSYLGVFCADRTN